MQMPLDFTVISEDSGEYKFHIPNTWFVKKTDATVLDRWIGWDKLNPKYTAKIFVPGRITQVIIDPTKRLADVYQVDNSRKRAVKLKFDSRIYNRPDHKNYELFTF